MSRLHSRLALAALGGLALATPAAAQNLIGPGSNRTGASIALVVALVAVVLAVRAFRARSGTLTPLLVGAIGVALAVLHLITSPGAVGTGKGRAGAVLALVLGAGATVLAVVARGRSRRAVAAGGASAGAVPPRQRS